MKKTFAIVAMAAIASMAISACNDDDNGSSDVNQFVGAYEVDIRAYSADNSSIVFFEGETTVTLSQDGAGLKANASLNTDAGKVVIEDLQLTSLKWMTQGSKTPAENGDIYYAEGYFFKVLEQFISIGGSDLSFVGAHNEKNELDDSGVFTLRYQSQLYERDETGIRLQLTLEGEISPGVNVYVYIYGDKK
ncbi:MAG: hypothetical protein LBS94_01060 [Prevotellaceae bacterium]|nr:hypothetical protein [Prevotellaceae bacterium]